ncbi:MULTISPECIES: ABC transporter ATP-binding protein [unclassified Arthrobacter]|uniref:ABC transporter ATP-binding protein n=1 Tax=unclassified Pseudarthrobacter TaxID=2647000 RepID=UPI0033987E58
MRRRSRAGKAPSFGAQFTMPLAQLGSMANLLQSGVASAERVFSLLDEDEELPDPAGGVSSSHGFGRGWLVFEDMSFSYSPDKPLISSLSLVAEPGQTVAIVGPAGAGKTTLVNLIMRFYELDAGRITLDGVDVTSVPRHELRSRLGMVLQDTWLFGRDRPGQHRLRPARGYRGRDIGGGAGDVRGPVRALAARGVRHVLEDEGANVSAGEKQLLALARAFLARHSVLILDEVTSSVDTRTEVLVQKAMRALRSDRTSFVIAHRLSTIRDADLVMEAGQIVDQGTHASLLAAGGAYARL